MNNPKVSIIMPTYNRAGLLPRAIESVLSSDMPDWELIIVDDGSTDNTHEVIDRYRRQEGRIRAAFHDKNRQVLAAKNTGLDLMRGEWFTTLDSDDEMVPNALSAMIRVPQTVDASINAVNCNCLDTTTGEFSCKGLNHDQWLDLEALLTKCHGELWGITKSSLLGTQRFNSKMRGGGEDTLWLQISRTAKRYYLHQALRIYHTEGTDRLCKMRRNVNLNDRGDFYCELALESEYLELMRQHRPAEYMVIRRNIALAMAMAGRRDQALRAYHECRAALPVAQRIALRVALLGGQSVARTAAWVAARAR